MSAAANDALLPRLRIFPLHGIKDGACTCPLGAECKDVGKHPMVRWRTYDENTKGPNGGYGIQTGSFNGIFVVDLDVKPPKDGKPGKDGIAAFVQLAAGRPIPDTLSVLTPSGGVHLYFRLPPDLYVPKSLSELGPGIDIIGEGGYVVGPGSPHKNGGIYQEAPEVLADAPEWLLALVVKTPEPPQSKPQLLVSIKSGTAPPDSANAVAALLGKAWPPEGQGRHPAQLALAGALCRDGWSETDAVEMLCAVCREAGDEDRPKRAATCRDTWAKAATGSKFTGWKELSKYVGDSVVAGARAMLKSKTESEAQERFRQQRANVTEKMKTPDPEHEYPFEPGMRGSGETRRATFGEILADLNDHREWEGVLMFDTFYDRIRAIDPPTKMDAETTGLNDNDVRLVRAWFEFHGKKASLQDIRDAIETIGRKRKSNCVVNWLKTLTWDGRERLDRVLPNYFQSPDGPYERAIGPRWFISLIARAVQPGCQVDYTLILEGEQEYRKSSALLSLMHDPLWYAENQSEVGTKDFYENMRGVWVMGFDELASLTNADNAKMKSSLTRRHDHFRKSYAHYSDNYIRGTVFCGTIDCKTYLKDAAGGRRFWPVRVQRPIDTSKIERDRDQIFAEALVRWGRGDVWYVDTPELRALCKTEQEERFEIDTWEETIVRWLNDPTKFSRKKVVSEPGSVFKGVAPFDGSEGFTTADVLLHAIGKPTSFQTRADATRVGSILRRLEMEVIRVRVAGGKQERRYVFSEVGKG
jgi:hypothetical protein